MKNSFLLFAVFAQTLLVPAVSGQAGTAFGSEEQVWYRADALADRLRGEKWKFNTVKTEISRLKVASEDLRRLQSYPSSITNLDPESEKKIEKSVDRLIKKADALKAELDRLESFIDDAVIIAMEMLKESPNEDMMELLAGDNIRRIQKLVVIKKDVDALWDNVTDVMELYEKCVGISRAAGEDGPFEERFFKVLIRQIGQASDGFYRRYHDYKDSLAEWGSQETREQMAAFDLSQIFRRMEDGDERSNLLRDLARLADRFRNKFPIGGINYHLGSTYLKDGQYHKAIRAFRQIGEESEFYHDALLGTGQALFALEKDDSLVVFAGAVLNDSAMPDSQMQQMRFLYAQSSYALGHDRELEQAILSYERKNGYYFKTLYLYAKSLIRQQRDREASEILKSIIPQTQLSENLRLDARMTLAFLKYEQEFYESALNDFKDLINQEGKQAEAMYGMVWCYVSMKDFTTAEVVLKKMINQFPDSPLAIEGITQLSRWRFIKALKLWEYKKNTMENRRKLELYQGRLKEMEGRQQLKKAAYEEIVRKLGIAEMHLASRLDVSGEEVASYIEQALSYIHYVNKYYRTGEFSRSVYSSKRESVLNKLSDLVKKSKSPAVGVSREKAAFRKELYRCQMQFFDMIMVHRDWLREYVNVSAGDMLQAGSTQTPAALMRSREKSAELDEAGLALAEQLLKNPLAAGDWEKLIFYKGYLEFEFEEDRIKLSKRQNLLSDSLAGAAGGETGSFSFYQDVRFEKTWLQLMNRSPRSEYIPYVLYYLGHAKLKQGSPQGVDLLERFLKEFPEHQYAQYVHMMLGDYFFSLKDIDHAIQSYWPLVGESSSPLFLKAIYKQSWSYYQAGKFAHALKGFSFILENELPAITNDSLSKVADEILKMISFSFAKQDTVTDEEDQKVREFIANFEDQDIAANVLHKMGLIYRQQGRLGKAQRLFNGILKRFKDFAGVPEVLMDLAIVYDIDNEFEKAIRVRETVFNNYNRQTEWYAGLKDEYHRQRADSLCESALYKIAFHYFAVAKLKGGGAGANSADSIINRQAFLKAIGAYEKFLQIYPNAKNAGKLYYQLAESYYEYGDFIKASSTYLKASRTLDPKSRSAAAYNAVISAEQSLEDRREDN